MPVASKFSYSSFHIANNKVADQTVQIRRFVCAFVVRISRFSRVDAQFRAIILSRNSLCLYVFVYSKTYKIIEKNLLIRINVFGHNEFRE